MLLRWKVKLLCIISSAHWSVQSQHGRRWHWRWLRGHNVPQLLIMFSEIHQIWGNERGWLLIRAFEIMKFEILSSTDVWLGSICVVTIVFSGFCAIQIWTQYICGSFWLFLLCESEQVLRSSCPVHFVTSYSASWCEFWSLTKCCDSVAMYL